MVGNDNCIRPISSKGGISMTDKDDKLELTLKSMLNTLDTKYHMLLDEEVIQNTPDRIRRAYDEICSGYAMNPESILSKRFKGSSGMVIEGNIEFVSMCEHHLLPFYGKAIVAYIPHNNDVVGISKLARVVEVFSKRLQTQERLTMQIAKTIMGVLQPRGVAVTVDASHQC